MNWKKGFAIGCLLLASSLPFACGSGPTEDPASRPEGAGDPSTPAGADGVPPGGAAPVPEAAGLEVSESGPERLAGSYKSTADAKIGLRFVSSKTEGGIALWLGDWSGNELVVMTGSARDGVMIRYGTKLTMRLAPGLVEKGIAAAAGKAPIPARPEVAAGSGFGASGGDLTVEGNADQFAAIESRPELALLPELSRALGARGLAGHQLPAALPLHAFAMTFASSSPAFRGAPAPRPAKPGETTSGARPSFLCTVGDVECCELHPNDPGCVPEPPGGGGPTQCSNPPVGSSCYGLCGPGCTCWFDVCGDCCYHPGCAIHDDWCGACSWTSPWYCGLCYSPAALIALGGC